MADNAGLGDVHKMKVADLKKVLKDRGLPTSGNKTELVDRLLAVGESVLDTSEKELLEEERLLDDSSDVLTDSPVKESNSIPSTDYLATKVSQSVTVNKPVKPTVSSTSSPATSVAAGTGALPETKQPSSSASGKIESRLKRFGVVSEDARKTARIERFLPSTAGGSAKPATGSSPKPAADGDALLKRAERFGVAASAANKTIAVSGTNDRLQKRAERFGQVSSGADLSIKGDTQERILKRKERFGGSSGAKLSSGVAEDDVEQKKRRMERFGPVAVK